MVSSAILRMQEEVRSNIFLIGKVSKQQTKNLKVAKMETFQLAKQALQFQKTVFENSFTAMVMAQEQTEKMFASYLENLPWVNEENKKTIQSSMDMAKKARDDYKKATDEGFAKFEEFMQKG